MRSRRDTTKRGPGKEAGIRHTGRFKVIAGIEDPALAESLAGRTAVAGLETLSLAELGSQAPEDWGLLLTRGLFPELWRAPDFERFLRAVASGSSGQVVWLEPYFENLGMRLVKSPKVYLADPGLLSFLLALDARTAADSPLVGSIPIGVEQQWMQPAHVGARLRVWLATTHWLAVIAKPVSAAMLFSGA